jgi:hypothetical protein
VGKRYAANAKTSRISSTPPMLVVTVVTVEVTVEVIVVTLLVVATVAVDAVLVL